jgi:segregation and condensation protein A
MSSSPGQPGAETAGDGPDLPFARVLGQPWSQLPRDLYIPPDALEVFLEMFEGPLDLLLYLIRRENLDILDIPIAAITDQYMDYVELMRELRLELAAEYLVMAAMLAEIKSRMLLPRSRDAGDEEGDPRAELVRRLQLYERFRQAAQDLDELPRLERDLFSVRLAAAGLALRRVPPPVALEEVLQALREVLRRAELFTHHRIAREPLSLRERMAAVLEQVAEGRFVPFGALFRPEEGRMGVVVSFMAVLELIRAGLLDLVQTGAFGPIHVRAPVAAPE